MKAVGYIRVSSDEQVKNYSLDAQKQSIEQHCKEQGIRLTKVFREEGESAKSANRPQLMEMINLCTSKK